MKISYNWLKQYVQFIDSPQKLADDLTDHGLSVESVNKIKDDYILDIEITANRGDCLSILGIAREISAIYNKKILQKNISIQETDLVKPLDIKISDDDLCKRYSARIIDNIAFIKSHKVIQERLESYGFRTLGNIVDITNYIMIKTGQPLHAFDYDKIKNGQVNIHLAKNNEQFVTLDGKERNLDTDTIVISDNQKIYDLSGIMGGFNTEVDKNTKTILLQSAVFDPVHIRNTSKRLFHTTDASYRYERGVDPENTVKALDEAVELLKEHTPNINVGKLVDIFPKKVKPINIKLEYDKVNSILGTALNPSEIIDYLQRLNFKNIKNNEFGVPSYRSYDVTLEIDLIEEVARLYGYKNIKPIALAPKKNNINKDYYKKENIRNTISQSGFTEIYSYSFADANIIKLLGIDLDNCTEISNPIAPENKFLRPTLITSMLTAFAKNPWAPEMRIFEIGKIFQNKKEDYELYIASSQKNDSYILDIINKLNIKSNIHTIDQKILDYLKIRKKIYFICVKLADIIVDPKTLPEISKDKVHFKNISEYPPTIRDLAFIVERKIDAKIIKNDIVTIDESIFIVELFDEFVSDKFGVNKKNIAFHIWMQNINGPMSNENTDIIINKIIKNITNKYNARLR